MMASEFLRESVAFPTGDILHLRVGLALFASNASGSAA